MTAGLRAISNPTLAIGLPAELDRSLRGVIHGLQLYLERKANAAAKADARVQF